MKCSFEKADLLEAINIVLKAVPAKTTMPVLECILIDARTDSILFLANDMEMAIQTTVPGTILEPGMIAIDAKLFSEIARKLPNNEVLITSEETDTVRISCEKANFRIPARRGDDFVFLPEVERNDYICISQFTLKEVVRQTIFSIAINDNNKLMTGELFEIRNGVLRVASLDGHRISLRNVELRDHYADKKVVVPGKTLSEISRILPGDRDKDVYIFFTNKHILFEFDDTILVSRLIEGEYFQVDRMISGDYDTRVMVNKKQLMESIERSILLVRESDKKPIVMDIRDEEMGLSLTSMIGSMNEELPVDKDGKDLMIAFNPRFLLDALRVIDDEEVSIYMINAKTPCFIRDEKESYVYLILPVNFTAPR